MRERMRPYLEDKNLAFNLLYSGTAKVKKIADESTEELRKALGLVDLEKQAKLIRL